MKLTDCEALAEEFSATSGYPITAAEIRHVASSLADGPAHQTLRDLGKRESRASREYRKHMEGYRPKPGPFPGLDGGDWSFTRNGMAAWNALELGRAIGKSATSWNYIKHRAARLSRETERACAMSVVRHQTD